MKLKIVALGFVPTEALKAAKHFRSSIITLEPGVDTFVFAGDSDLDHWAYSDELIGASVREYETDLTLILTNQRLENNWYARRLGNSRAVITFYEMDEILRSADIPLGNLIYRVVNAYYLMYVQNGDSLPDYNQSTNHTHDDTRGCLFDMTGQKSEIVRSCASPIICSECTVRIHKGGVPAETLDAVKGDLRRVRRTFFQATRHELRRRPFVSFLCATGFGAALSSISGWMAQS